MVDDLSGLHRRRFPRRTVVERDEDRLNNINRVCRLFDFVNRVCRLFDFVSTLTYQTPAATNFYMGHPRVMLPRVGVSFEGTRELFGLSANDATRVTRLADRAFEQCEGFVASTKRQVKRKAAVKRTASATARKVKKTSNAARRK